MKRERITITVDSQLLQSVDSLIDKERLRNRSQTIEHLLKEGIGLHQLSQAFLFIDESYDSKRLQTLAALCSNTDITHFFICLSVANQHLFAEVSTLIYQAYEVAPVLELVPADFGSGGALVLQKSKLTNSFLLAWLYSNTPLPENLINPYLFHRSHHLPLTQLLSATQSTYIFAGLAIAEPDLLSVIPAGMAQLEEDVFPELIKKAKVRAYPF